MLTPLLKISTIGLIAALVLGFLGYIHPAFDTIANFRAHLSIALLVLCLIWIFNRGRLLVLMSATVALIGVYFSTGFLPVISSNSGKYSLLNLNLYFANKTPQKVFELVKRYNPDILAFTEYSQNWQQRLKSLESQYPHTYHCAEWSAIGGSVIYSRWPMSQDKEFCSYYAPLGLKEILIEGKAITIGVVHLRWPWPASGPRQVDHLKPVLKNLAPNALVVGDFNATTWTWLVRRFASYGNLKIITTIGPTWMYRLLPISLAKYIGLPIDNVMVKGNIIVDSARTLGAVGSDHLPILVEFHFD